MITWDNAQTISQRLAQDTSSAGVTFLNLMMNIGYKDILNVFGRQQTEIEAHTDLDAGQRAYQVPIDCAWPKTVTLLDGTTRYNVTEEPSDRMWDYLTQNQIQGRSEKFHFKPRFGIGGGVIELEPIPSSSDYNLALIYEATDKDLSKSAYTAGTISVTNNSTTVTGSGTTFTSDMVGRYLQVTSDGEDRLFYRIAAFVSTTSLTLENVYQSTTVTGTAYQIVEAFNLPEDMHILPIYYSLWHWWESKKDMKQAQSYRDKYEGGIIAAKKRYSTTTRDTTIIDDVTSLTGVFGAEYPEYYPTEVV